MDTIKSILFLLLLVTGLIFFGYLTYVMIRDDRRFNRRMRKEGGHESD